MSDERANDPAPAPDDRDFLQPTAGLVSWAPSMITLDNLQLDPADIVRFLSHLSVHGNISAACRYSGISRSSQLRLRADVPEFRSAFEQAMENAADVIDSEIHRRGTIGTMRKVFQGGKCVDTVREMSDRLLELRAKALHPAYRDIGKSSVNVAANAQAGAVAGGVGPPLPPVDRTPDTPDHVLTLGEGIQKLLEVASANNILPGNMRVTRDETPPTCDDEPEDDV